MGLKSLVAIWSPIHIKLDPDINAPKILGDGLNLKYLNQLGRFFETHCGHKFGSVNGKITPSHIHNVYAPHFVTGERNSTQLCFDLSKAEETNTVRRQNHWTSKGGGALAIRFAYSCWECIFDNRCNCNMDKSITTRYNLNTSCMNYQV